MPNPRLANRYAKSLIDLAVEKGQLEVVYADMKFLQAACKNSKELVSMLQSPIITADKKDKVLEAITAGKATEITTSFNKLLVKKGREFELPEIVEAYIEQYNAIKGIHKVKLTTAIEVSQELKQSIIEKAVKESGVNSVELETKVDTDLIGGFVLEFNNNLVDASIARDLRDIRKQFSKNLYVPAIR
ncbi:MAG: ATP synthase F1 subunit delta [Chitinophagaceae bacterium]